MQATAWLVMLATLIFVLGASGTTWARRQPCDAPDQQAQALFNYSAFYSCSEVLPGPVKLVLLAIWLVLLISLLATTADNFFVPQLNTLSNMLGLSEDVAGVTLLALGNGMPDVMTATSAINKADDLPLTMGEFFGAANFILSVVLGCVLLCQRAPTRVLPWSLVRDSLSYVGVLALMAGTTWDGEISVAESLVFIGVYAAYVALVVTGKRFGQAEAQSEAGESWRCESGTTLNSEANLTGISGVLSCAAVSLESVGELSPPDLLEGLSTESMDAWTCVQSIMEFPFTLARHASIPAANWNAKRRLLATACPSCSLLISLLSFGGWDAFQRSWIQLPIWMWCVLSGASCGIGMLAFSSPARPPRWHGLLLLGAFASAVSWFNLLANECVAILELFGISLGVSSSILGMTVLAWGNSIGDLVADTAVARQGKVRTAVAGCFGSPLLSDMLGLGVALSSYTLSKGPLRAKLTTQTKVAAGFALVSVLTTAVALTAHNFRCPRRLAIILFVEYALFMATSLCIEA